ncbi:tRNA uracil 4-sulfurtransferase ThiI [Liberiplasma polymorphum]|uniref:tRNA uracil 4-sulfurtransferase ThiI n=1 Tax=Liberiplasma polymorphum TaxID=3374570 RepID=UPI0037713456
MYDIILIRYGDITLKGKNKKKFIDKAVASIQFKISNTNLTYERQHDRLYIHLNNQPYEPIITQLKKISGIASFSLVVSSKTDLSSIESVAIDLIKSAFKQPATLRVDTKRADKLYPIGSMEVSKKVSGFLLKTFEGLSVDLTEPDLTLYIEIRKDKAYIYLNKIKGLGGFPVGIAGKSLLLLSGGIDSPVAGFLTMKQGVQVEGFHFESTPLTSIESVQKVIDLTKKMSVYAEKSTMKLHLVPFTHLHKEILNLVPEPYHITIMRRMMIRLADKFALIDHTPAIITGDSIGQVASQTLDSINTINAVTTRPILRPLITMDKIEIIKYAKMIDCYAISIRPFDDCCSIYVPSQPSTSPRDYYANRYERLFDYETIIEDILENIITLEITPNSTIDLTEHGLTVVEAYKHYQEVKS